MSNKLITIEGTDCSGKQTQSELLAKNLRQMGYNIHQSGFPMYDTPTGRIVGNCYLGKDGHGFFPEGAVNVDRRVSGLYFAADRLYNIGKIEEMLQTGSVILDRYVDSNLAHQGAKIQDEWEREKTYNFFENLEYGLLELPRPDVRVLLYMPSEYAAELKKHRAEAPDEHERDEAYLKRSEKCYLEIAQRNDYKIINCVKDGVIRSIEDIQQELLRFVCGKLV